MISFRSLLSAFLVVNLAFLDASAAFVHPSLSNTRHASSQLYASSKPANNFEIKIAAASAFIVANVPASVIAAVVEDDYEYGKVDAPIGLAWGVGVLAILTALLPIALKGGEEAFEEIKERDSATFGKDNKDLLKGGKKK